MIIWLFIFIIFCLITLGISLHLDKKKKFKVQFFFIWGLLVVVLAAGLVLGIIGTEMKIAGDAKNIVIYEDVKLWYNEKDDTYFTTDVKDFDIRIIEKKSVDKETAVQKYNDYKKYLELKDKCKTFYD